MSKKKKIKETETDRIFHKLRNNKIIAYIIVAAVMIVSIISFFDKIESGYQLITKKFSSKRAIEYSEFDFIQEKYNPDSLKAKKLLHVIVSRRDAIMHYYIPSYWDNEEPLDGPAGMRYKTYYLPKDSRCEITAIADIACIKDLVDSLDLSNPRDSFDNQVYRALSYLDEGDPTEGFCNLDDYVSKRMDDLTKIESFELLALANANKIYLEKTNDNYKIEGTRLSYSFKRDKVKYRVMEVITYLNNVAFVLYLGAPEERYLEYEDLFIDISNNCYFSPM